MTEKPLYEPIVAKITRVDTETPNIKTFALELEEPIDFATGQFIQLTVPGIGEAPFTPSSRPGKTKNIEITVMEVGVATKVLHSKKAGDMLAVRGPYGNGFPVEKLRNRELLIIGGGCGLAPLRTLIYEIIDNRNHYPRVVFLYGCRSSKDILYKGSFGRWDGDMETYRTVDEGDTDWKEDTGVVTKLLSKVKIDVKTCAVVAVGPPVMMKYATIELKKMGISDDRIYVSLEKNMTCGFGKCRHCMVGKYYVCKDGPVFAYSDVKDIPDVWD
ncbi:MAG: FAD/NAD(P)-binding protein [Elusimicrobiota bacterium]